MTNDYHGPCLILLDRSTTVEVRRGGRIESVSMPTTHDEPSGRRVVITQRPQQGDI